VVRMLKGSITCACSAFVLSPGDLLFVTVKSRVLCDVGLRARCGCLVISYLRGSFAMMARSNAIKINVRLFFLFCALLL